MSDIEFTVTPTNEPVKKRTGVLNVRLSLYLLQAALRLKDDVKLVYAGDFDYANQSIKLTFIGEGLPIPEEGCIGEDGWMKIMRGYDGTVQSSELDHTK